MGDAERNGDTGGGRGRDIVFLILKNDVRIVVSHRRARVQPLSHGILSTFQTRPTSSGLDSSPSDGSLNNLLSSGLR